VFWIWHGTPRQGDDDPMKVARRAKFLKEYWGVRRGGDYGNQYKEAIPQNGEKAKTSQDIAEAVGVDAKHLNRLLKLNDLIPPLQNLVSANKLNKTAAEQLAYLSEEVQQNLWETLGEEIGGKTVAEAKNIRKKLEDAQATAQAAQAQAEDERKRTKDLQAQLQDALSKPPEIVEKVVEKIPESFKQLTDDEINRLKTELESKERSSKKAHEEKRQALQQKEDAEHRAREAEMEAQRIKQTYETAGISQEQCNVADQIENLLTNTRKELVGLIELLNLKSLPKERYLHLSISITKLNMVTSDFREEIDKLDKNNVTFLRK